MLLYGWKTSMCKEHSTGNEIPGEVIVKFTP